MAATIVQGPSNLVSAAYAAIPFIVIDYNTLGDPSTLLEVNVYVDGELKATQKHKPGSRDGNAVFDAGAGLQGNYFEINLTGCISSCFDNELALCDPNDTDINITASECSLEFYMEVVSWYPNDDGILVSEEIPVQSQTYFAINATRRHCDPQTLDEFVSDSQRSFLTNRPLKQCVCLTDNECLAFWKDSTGALVQVRSFDKDGNQLQSGFIFTNADANSVGIIGVGPLNINNSNFTIGSVTIDENVAYYEVGIIGGTSTTIPRRYYVLPCCETVYRLAFLNALGKYDYFSILCNEEDTYETTGDTFEKSLPLYFDQRIPEGFSASRGVNNLYLKGTDGFIACAKNLKIGESEWLKELQRSPSIFLLKDGKVVPVYVKKKKRTIRKTRQRNNDIILEFTYSNSDYSQRN